MFSLSCHGPVIIDPLLSSLFPASSGTCLRGRERRGGWSRERERERLREREREREMQHRIGTASETKKNGAAEEQRGCGGAG